LIEYAKWKIYIKILPKINPHDIICAFISLAQSSSMTYTQGVRKMKKLADELKQKGEPIGSFVFGSLLITYPGYKQHGDYKLTEKGTAPKHTDIILEIFKQTTAENIDIISHYLDDVFHNGLNARPSLFLQSFTEKLFWITLQEEINYPQPVKAGRRLPFQRFFEAALCKMGLIEMEVLIARTNNHGKQKPPLLDVKQYRRPSFYK
jgi:hypothetical protein